MPLLSPESFLTELFGQLEPRPGVLDHLFLDHLCYRVATVARYEELRDQLLQEGNELVVESPINGRRISTFRLVKPVVFGPRQIPLLELPEPKNGSPYPEGYEHVEFVTDRPLADFIPWIVEHLQVPATALDRKGVDKQHNPDLRLRLSNGSSVKFHEQALDVVIARELSGQTEI